MARPSAKSLANLRTRSWQPGQSGNPGGIPCLPADLKAIKSLSRMEVCRIVAKYARMNTTEFEAAKTDLLTPKLHLCILAIMDEAHRNGDHAPLAWLLDRAIGKATEEEPKDIEHENDIERLQSLSNAELLELAKKKIADFEAA